MSGFFSRLLPRNLAKKQRSFSPGVETLEERCCPPGPTAEYGAAPFFLDTVRCSHIALLAVHDAIAMAIVFFLWSLVGFSFAAPVQTRILRGASDAPNLASTLISTAFNIGIAVGAWLGGLALNQAWGYADLPWISAFFLAAALGVALYSLALERRGSLRAAI